MHLIKAPRAFALAAFAAMIVLGVSQAAAQGTAVPYSPPRAAAGLRPGTGPMSLRWVRLAVAKAIQQNASTRGTPTTTIGNFSQCPTLPAGDNPANFICSLIHITGGVLDLGDSHQIINRPITISFGEGSDSSGNTVLVPGTLKAKPMPVLGGIFETPQVDNITSTDPNLQLHVQTVGVAEALDPTGQTALITSQLIKAINPVFGPACRVGTTRAPIVLDPTFGTTSPPPPNTPESGHVDSVEHVGKELVIIGTVVDNAFAAPAATGCGPSGALDHVVNAVGGLPSPPGTNNAVFQVTVEIINYADI